MRTSDGWWDDEAMRGRDCEGGKLWATGGLSLRMVGTRWEKGRRRREEGGHGGGRDNGTGTEQRAARDGWGRGSMREILGWGGRRYSMYCTIFVSAKWRSACGGVKMRNRDAGSGILLGRYNSTRTAVN